MRIKPQRVSLWMVFRAWLSKSMRYWANEISVEIEIEILDGPAKGEVVTKRSSNAPCDVFYRYDQATKKCALYEIITFTTAKHCGWSDHRP